MDTSFCEFVDNRGLTLTADAAAGTVKNVKILGPQSANGRIYSEAAMRDAVRMYEGAKVYLNHPTKAGEPRRVEDRFGEMRGVSFRPGEGLFAETFAYNPKHSFAEAFAWNAQHAPHAIGFSHNINGKTATQNGKLVVESITKVNSVDLVAEPATTRGLHESVEPESGEPTVLTLEQVKAQPELVKAILQEQASSQEAQAQANELKQLKEENDRLKTAAAAVVLEQTIATELAEAKLPAFAVTDTFKITLREAKDAAARKLLIEDRQALAKNAPQKSGNGPQSKEQGLAEGVQAGGGFSAAKYGAANGRKAS